MSIHLIKLCVGCESVQQLAGWNAARDESYHITRHYPKRADELLDGGSLYWVIGGYIRCRQRIVGLERIRTDTGPKCKISFEKRITPVRPLPRKAFQGWRYFKPEDVPDDLVLGQGINESLPDQMVAELSQLGVV